MRESEIEKRVVQWAKLHDLLPLKLTPMGDGGWPDHLWLFYFPAIAFIEFKQAGKKAKLRQELRIAELTRRGYPVKVIDNVSEGITFLETEVLSRDSRKAGNLTGLRWLSHVSWYGEDNNQLSDI